jgi:hypothetical protein
MAERDQQAIGGDDPLMRTVAGSFFRAGDPADSAVALAGSRSAGQDSPPDVPTLYLSASLDGVAAAMIAHTDDRSHELRVLRFKVGYATIDTDYGGWKLTDVTRDEPRH